MDERKKAALDVIKQGAGRSLIRKSLIVFPIDRKKVGIGGHALVRSLNRCSFGVPIQCEEIYIIVSFQHVLYNCNY